MNIKAELVNRISKAGKSFTAIELTFPNGYKKLIFLDYAESYMFEQKNNNK